MHPIERQLVKLFGSQRMPNFLRERAGQFWESRQNHSRSSEAVFTEIYRNNSWGGTRGEFYSGFGSADEEIAAAYIALITEQAASEGFRGLTFVDLGCGDFRVIRQLLPLCATYIGVDIVKPLVRWNQEHYGNATTRFLVRDIVTEELPDGDVCFVRYVLQHLSNQQIGVILPKLKKYKWVFITEHYPTDNPKVKPNRDKVHGGYTRMPQNSGVYLSEPPFALPAQGLTMLQEIALDEHGKHCEQGVIRTFLYKPYE